MQKGQSGSGTFLAVDVGEMEGGGVLEEDMSGGVC